MSAARDGATTLYRCHGELGLLYIGVSSDWDRRKEQHRKSSPWFGRTLFVELEDFHCRPDALRAERRAIRTENPIYNVTYSPRLVQYRFGAGAGI